MRSMTRSWFPACAVWQLAVYDHRGEAICAISLSSLASRITPQRIPVLGRLLAETSAQLTAALSGEMPPVNAIAS